MNLFAKLFPKPIIKEVIKEKIVYKQSQRTFDSARFDRLTTDFLSAVQKLNEDIKGNLSAMRGRSRTLSQNDDFYKRCLELWVSYVIGSKGVTLVNKARDANGKEDKNANDQVERAFKEFGKKKYFTRNMQDSFYSFQVYEEHCFARDGETFTRIHRGWENDYGLTFSFIDPDFLDEGYNVDNFQGGKISQGIQFDSMGGIVGYWFNDPKDMNTNNQGVMTKGGDKKFIPADEIIHRFNKVEPNQIRGFPVFQNIMIALFGLSKLNESEMVSFRFSSCKMATIEEDFPDESQLQGLGTEVEETNSRQLDMLEPGEVIKLPQGQHFNLINPDHKSGNWETFARGILRSAASGCGLPYCLISNDYEGLSGDTIRLIMNDTREWAMTKQNIFIDDFADKVYSEFILFALMKKKIAIPFSKVDKLSEHEFRGRPFQSLRPLEDQQALALAVVNGNGSRTDYFRSLNLTTDDVFANLGYEEELAKFYNFPIRNQGGTTQHNINAGVKE